MQETQPNSALPEIPSKRYFTIGEVAELCAVKQHVLRYWEQEFPELKPTKRRGNRRYYQRNDIELIRTIRSLLYEQGFTIGGARQQLGAKSTEQTPEDSQANLLMRQMRAELEGILELLSIENTGNKQRRAALSLIKS